MLPDLPELKSDLQLVLERYVRAEVQRRMPGLNESPQHQIHEGVRMRIVRADGTVDVTELHGASAEVRISAEETEVMTPEARQAVLDSFADDLARQISRHAFATINQTLEETGQSVNLGGQPLDAEGILQVIERLQIDFDEMRRPKGMSVVVPPAAGEATRRAFESLETDPKLKVRADALLEKKWMEWRDREASRKLVG